MIYVEQYIRKTEINKRTFVVEIYTYYPPWGIVLSGIIRSESPVETVEKKPNEKYANLRWVYARRINKQKRWVLFDENAMIVEIQKILQRKNVKRKFLFFLVDVFSVYQMFTYKIAVIDLESKTDKILTLKQLDWCLKQENVEEAILNAQPLEEYKTEKRLKNFFYLRNLYAAKLYFKSEEYFTYIFKQIHGQFMSSYKKTKKRS